MHGINNIKFINARQAKEIYQYKNIKEKIHKTNTAIWYNNICNTKYILIKVNGHNKQSHNTLKIAIRTRINQELKYLYVQKQKPNKQLYQIRVIFAGKWKKNWQYINLILMKNFNTIAKKSIQILTKS